MSPGHRPFWLKVPGPLTSQFDVFPPTHAAVQLLSTGRGRFGDHFAGG